MLHMPKKSLAILSLVLLGSLSASAARAETLACPALDSAVQIQACPSDEELRYTFMGFCGDNARLYGRDALTCASFENYKEAKNNALWESADGAFSGYLSCNVGADAIKASKPLKMSAERKSTLTRLICDYENDLRMVHRTKASCTVEVADCSTGACQAKCE